MANLLIVDTHGRRRVALEVAASALGHRTYCAGSAAEALRMAGIYVPDAVIILMPDPESARLIHDLRSSEDLNVKSIPILADRTQHNGASGVGMINTDPASIFAAVEKVVGRNGDHAEAAETNLPVQTHG